MASYIFKYGKRTPSTHLEAWWHGHLWNHKQILPINTQELFFMITQFTSNQFTRAHKFITNELLGCLPEVKSYS